MKLLLKEKALLVNTLQWVLEQDTSSIDVEGLYELRLKIQKSALDDFNKLPDNK